MTVPTSDDWRSLGNKLRELELSDGEAAALLQLIEGAEVTGFLQSSFGELLDPRGVAGSAQPNAGIRGVSGSAEPNAGIRGVSGSATPNSG